MEDTQSREELIAAILDVGGLLEDKYGMSFGNMIMQCPAFAKVWLKLSMERSLAEQAKQ